MNKDFILCQCARTRLSALREELDATPDISLEEALRQFYGMEPGEDFPARGQRTRSGRCTGCRRLVEYYIAQTLHQAAQAA